MKILIIRNYPSYMEVRDNKTYNIQEVGLAKAIIRAGHSCDILFWTDKEECDVHIPVNGTSREIVVFYRHGFTKIKNTVFVKCKSLFEKYDVLQPCEYNQFQSLLLAKKFPGKTVIYHGPYYSAFNKNYNLYCKLTDWLFIRRYKKFGTKFIVKSELAKVFLLNKGISNENISVSGVGIDVEMLTDRSDECDESLYRQMKVDGNNPKLLYIGRLEERRNIKFIIDVFDRVHKKVPEARLYMIGKGEEQYVRDVFSHAEELGCRKYIYWQERMEQRHLSNIYKQADFFLLPTEYEIFGMVLLEAMYYGKVVITTNNGGASTLIKDGENGLIRDLKVDNWVATIINLIENRECLVEIGSRASADVVNGYTWDKLVNKFVEEYKALGVD